MAGRPREFDRDQALRKAMLLFWQHGYEGTSMSALVEALGIASARIYAAFGSKEQLFREAVALYEDGEGGFAPRALEQATLREAIGTMLREAVLAYTRRGRPHGCLVVSSASSVSPEGEGVQDWLASHRRQRTVEIIARLQQAQAAGELPAGTGVQALGDLFAALLHGISVQARDGVSRERLLALVEASLSLLPGPEASN
ncbi:TetR/AcrR family transcriptional regulator [Stenotrophomonas sp. ZAC14A_NAIMI4_1]|uniref:TetR/AcrR family transcriptional regulator n=1 Tax=Stenotrophomonas sp. ZAC14A_NAIMI4_1 TaxID=2072412 RepID=UPI000D54129E|nr:TetR/AcrR family transcriptional regulator [Stenotrophomonas sp. ZAC14A_NAIMI4_1]AWH44008.1 TetR family transcriptional regulator [Stenotrophomonas sp. ZAC14A_NAIMI4_1]